MCEVCHLATVLETVASETRVALAYPCLLLKSLYNDINEVLRTIYTFPNEAKKTFGDIFSQTA